jgi:hypothetical protein
MPKKITQTVVETKNDDVDDAHDELLQKLDDFFDGISSSCTVGVYREQPKSLQSYLEEIELSDGKNPIDMEYLKNKWGGRVLKLIIRGEDGRWSRRLLIPMRSYPPKVDGQVIPEWGPLMQNPSESPVSQPRVENTNPIEMFKQMNEILRSNAQPVSTNDTMAAIMVPLMQSLIERSFSQPVQNPTNGNPNNLLEMMQAMQAMRDFVAPQFKQSETPSTDENSNPMIMKLMDIGQAIVEKRSQPKQAMLAPPTPHIVNPQIPPYNTPQNAQLSEHGAEKNDDTSPFTVEDAGKLRRFLSTLKGKEAAALFFETIQGLPEHEQEAAIDSVAKGFGFEEIDESGPDEIQDSARNDAGNSGGNR